VTPLGIAWGLASAVLFATYSLLGSVAVGRFRASTLLVWGLGFATAFWLVVLGPSAVISVFESPLSALAICYVAVVSTIIPFGAFLTALHYIAPTNATVTATIEPVLAAIGAYFLFGEVLTAPQILGGLLVIAAIVVVQLPDRTQPLPELPPGS
jgi:drug/metabolite transporter (DMT)-like permease